MKICYLNHDLNSYTGAGRFCLSLLNCLKKEVSDFEYRVLAYDNFLPKTKIGLFFALLKIRAIFKKYDIIQALDGWPYGFIAALASFGLRKKIIITAVGTGAVQPLYIFWKKPLLKWAYKRADKVVATSNNTKQEILKIIPDLDIQVINHGVEFEKFKIPAKVEARQSRQNSKFKILDGLRPYILSVGALKKRKGYEYSIEAFSRVAKKFPDLKYIIVGSGSERENLELRIKNYGLSDRIVFLENIPEEELIAIYQNAELFILLPQDINKDIEGFGLVFLEAAAAGLPVVATRGSSAGDAVLDGKTGFLVPQIDYKETAGIIEKLLSQPDLRNQFSKESLNFAKTMSWERVARQYGSLYHNLYI